MDRSNAASQHSLCPGKSNVISPHALSFVPFFVSSKKENPLTNQRVTSLLVQLLGI
jgi:hypothetical protein